MTATTSSTADQYAALSRRAAADGDHRTAQLAAWASDVHVLEQLLWENGLDQAPDPATQLAAVGESVAASVEEASRALPTGATLTLRQVVEVAREAMVTTFDESVHQLLADRFSDLGHLDEAPARHGGDRDSRATRTAVRLDGRTPVALAAELRTAAGDCATMAGLLAAGGEEDAARRLAEQADTAAFEAYLLTAALGAGDEGLAGVDLRWELVTSDEHPSGTPVRERFTAAVGSAERAALTSALAASETP